jgi:hypothetical protein
MKNIILLGTLLILTRIGSAQFSENFDDGDFVGWAGDDTAFIIDALFQLQLDGNCEDGGTNYLSAAASTFDTATWEFFIDLGFDPSASNYTRFYLQSDNPDLAASLNGYYIRIGEDGTDDAVKLYRQEGFTHTLLLTGILAEVAVAPKVRIKVIRTTENEWQLFVDATGGFTFVNEGSVVDDIIIGGDYIGWFCKYTSTRCDDFFLDDITVSPLYFDDDPPVISTLSVVTSTQIELDFNENIELLSADDESNYTIDGGVGNPIDATRGPTDFSKVLLTFITDFPEAILLTLTASNIADEEGNILTSDSKSFIIYTVNQYDIVMNEIFADPEPHLELPTAEYIELYNTTDIDIDLTGFTISDATSESDPFPSFILAANDYVIVIDENVVDSFAGFTDLLLIPSLPSLNNDGDDLVLKDASGNLIHSISYELDWYDNAIKEDGGWSLEMIDPSNPCQGDANWTASEDVSGGTPGEINSVFGENADDVPPMLVGAYPSSLDTVIAFFDEDIDLNSADITDFILSNGIGSPLSLILDINNPDFIGMVFGSPLNLGVVYTLTAENLTDCSGNNIGTFNVVELGIPEPVDSGDIVINEILFNAYTDGFDFVELYNTSNKIIDLSKIIIGEMDLTDTSEVIEFGYVSKSGKLFFPQSYMCVTANIENVTSTYHVIDTGNFVTSSDLPSFADNEGIAVIYDPFLNEIDRLHFYDDWQYALLTDDDGVSLERVNYKFETQNEDNWHSAAEDVYYATPGYQNSVFGNVVGGGEIVLEYTVFSPDGDGYHDLLLISYTTAGEGYSGMFKIFDAQGRIVNELSGLTTLSREGFITWDGVDADDIAAKTGIYILYAELFNEQGNVEKHKVKFTLVRG